MDTEYFNLYIETILTEVSELTKSKLLLQTQLSWQKSQIEALTELKNKLEQANNELLAQLREAKEEKRNKKEKTVVADKDTF